MKKNIKQESYKNKNNGLNVKNNKTKTTKELTHKIITYLLLILAFAFIIWVIVLNTKEESMNYSIRKQNGISIYNVEDVSLVESNTPTDLVLMLVNDYGAMVAELYPDVAPITVENFKELVSNKYYDGLTFHRVIKNFMIQTGDPTGTGRGGSDKKIKGEFINNGVANDISHTREILSMARVSYQKETDESYNSASSQFFIVQKDSKYLDGNYAAFGKVLNGLDIIDKIASVETDENDKPLSNVTIESIKFVNYYEGEE